MPDYTKEHGATFINMETGESRHTYNDFGLFPSSVGMPDPPGVQTMFIEVPGMDGSLDATQSLDGTVHYEDREYSQKFVDLNGRGLWHKRYSKVQNFIHGKQLKMILDDDPDWYYIGRFSVEEPGPKSYRNVLEISAVLRPYKYAINSTLEDWLWDPFSFEEGVIREYKDIFVDTAEDITVIGSEMPVVPTIIVVSENGDGMDLTYKGTRYHLADGRNRIVTMVITANESVFHFEGLGFVSIDFREGSL